MVKTEGTELLVHAKSAKSWLVVERPEGDAVIEDLKLIKTLYACKSRNEAIAFAEGRQSATGQPIRAS